MSTPPLLHLSAADLVWRPLSPGTRLAVLKRLPDGGSICRIQGAPGAVFPEHQHYGGEEAWILSGDYADPDGTYYAGDYVSYPAGSRHQPWTVSGCDLLVIAWSGPPRGERADASPEGES
ncbi:MAG: hypothetical protein GEEBNDBF_01051 [bacterium]|nr:hypothetical protein [bacterium]